MADIKFSQFPSGSTPTTGDQFVGLRAGANTRFTFDPTNFVSSVSGTTNRITSTGGSNPVLDISASYVGQSSITTLGTIGTGVWQGSVIGSTYGGTGVNNGSSTITLAGSLVTSGAFTSTFTMTGTTGVTFPTTGTLATTSQLPVAAALTRTNDTNVTLTLGGTPATALLQATSLTLGWTGTLDVSRGGTGTGTAFTAGSVIFAGASGVYSQDNSNLFWDDTNNRLGIGTAAPNTGLDVNGTTSTTAINCSNYRDSGGQPVLTFSNAITAANYFQMQAVNTGNKPIFVTTGTDSNIGMILSTKGTGAFQLSAATTSPLQFNCGTSNQHTANFAFADTAGTQTITFPDGNGTVAFVGDADFTWSTVSGTTQAVAVDNGYVSGNAAQTTFTLPATAAVGAACAVEGLGAGGWVLTANSGQTIKIGTSTTSTAGSLTSVASSDNVYVTCIVANTTWRVRTTNSNGLTIT